VCVYIKRFIQHGEILVSTRTYTAAFKLILLTVF